MKRTPLIPTCLLLAGVAVAQEPTSRPTSRPGESVVKARSGGFFGLRFAEAKRGDDAVLAIESVFDGSDAERLGFRKGDLITGVCGFAITDGDHFIKLLYGTLPDDVGVQARRMSKMSVPEDGPFLNVLRDGEEIRIRGGLADLDKTPAVGDRAPSFRLSDAAGENEVELSKMIGAKPVVLVFGSYT